MWSFQEDADSSTDSDCQEDKKEKSVDHPGNITPVLYHLKHTTNSSVIPLATLEGGSAMNG